MFFRKGMTLKRFKWKSLEFLTDSFSSPDLHRLLVPQLTRATCQQNRWLLPLWYQLPCWRRAAAHLYRTMLVVLEHSTSGVTCTIKHTLHEKSTEDTDSLKADVYWCNRTCTCYMISKWRLTASADEVISHRDLGISRLDAFSVQSVSDAFISLQWEGKKCDLLLFGNTKQLNLHPNPKLTLSPSLAWASFFCVILPLLVKKKSFSSWVASSFSSGHKKRKESAEVRQALSLLWQLRRIEYSTKTESISLVSTIRCRLTLLLAGRVTN